MNLLRNLLEIVLASELPLRPATEVNMGTSTAILPFHSDSFAASLLVGLLAFILFEATRRYRLVRTLLSGPPRDRPTVSPITACYFRVNRLGPEVITTGLVTLASKGFIRLRAVGDGLDLTKNPDTDTSTLAPEEKAVFENFVGSRDYVDITTVFPDEVKKTLDSLAGLYSEDHIESPYLVSNRSFRKYMIAYVLLSFLFLSLTYPDPSEVMVAAPIMGFFIVVIGIFARNTFGGLYKVFRYRPSFIKLILSPTASRFLELGRFFVAILYSLKAPIKVLLVGGFMLLFSVLMLIQLLGSVSAIVLTVMILTTVAAYRLLPMRPSEEHADLIAESIAFGKKLQHGSWEECVGHGYLENSREALDELKDGKATYLPTEVPPWFSKSGDPAQVPDVLKALGDTMPDAISRAAAEARHIKD